MASDVPPPQTLPPGSLGLPWIGETLAWVADPFAFLNERFRRHGPVFKTRLLGDNVLCCGGPEAFTAFVDTTRFTRVGASPPHIERLVGAGTLPFVDGPGQKRNKRLLLQAFRPEALSAYLTSIAPVIDRFAESWAGKQRFSWSPELARLTLVIFDTLFVGADPSTENLELKRNLEDFLPGILALPIPVGGYPRAMRARKFLVDYLAKVVRARRAEPRQDAVSFILAARDGAGRGFTDEEVTAEMLHILFAGYGAMIGNFGYAVWALADHADVRERARREVLEHTRPDVTFDQLAKLTFVQQFWKEILRFYPTVPHTFLTRVVAPTTVGGFHVPAGWKAMGVIQSALHDGRVYRDPEKFDPDRFGPDRAEDRQAPNAFVPQGGGAPDDHRCLGESVSGLVMKLFLAKLLRDYEWELTAKPTLRWKFPPTPEGGLPVRFQRRTAS